MKISMRLLNRKKHSTPSDRKRPPFRNVSSEPLYKRNPVPTKKESAPKSWGELYDDFIELVFLGLVIAMLLFDMHWICNFDSKFFWPVFALAGYFLSVRYSRDPVNYKTATIILIVLFVATHYDVLLYYVKQKLF
jgi:hypothetical protein